MTALHGLLQTKVLEIETQLNDTDTQLTYERNNSSNLRKQIKMLQLSAEDTAWELQEQLAHATNTLQIERGMNSSSFSSFQIYYKICYPAVT